MVSDYEKAKDEAKTLCLIGYEEMIQRPWDVLIAVIQSVGPEYVAGEVIERYEAIMALMIERTHVIKGEFGLEKPEEKKEG
jgi:hypothetical protein